MLALPAMFVLLVTGCGGSSSRNMLAPSDLDRADAKPGAPLVDNSGTTTVSFDGFDPATVQVMIHTTTISPLGQPYIDAGRIHLQILVDGVTRKPVPCGSAGATWVRFDNQGGGIPVSGGATTHAVDLDDLSSRGVNVGNAGCGDRSASVRNKSPAVGRLMSRRTSRRRRPTPSSVASAARRARATGRRTARCPRATTERMAGSSLTLGTVNYTDLQLRRSSTRR